MAQRIADSEPFGTPVSLGSMFPQMHTMIDPCLSADGSALLFNSLGLLANPAAFGDVWQVSVIPPPPLSISLLPAPVSLE